MGTTRTFIDSGVLIAAARGEGDVSARALEVLDDPAREFITSDFVRLETLPKAKYFKQDDEARLYEEFFKSAQHYVEGSKDIIDRAQIEAETSGLHAFDALHVVVAHMVEADELVTGEGITKAIFRTRLVPIKTIHPSGDKGA